MGGQIFNPSLDIQYFFTQEIQKKSKLNKPVFSAFFFFSSALFHAPPLDHTILHIIYNPVSEFISNCCLMAMALAKRMLFVFLERTAFSLITRCSIWSRRSQFFACLVTRSLQARFLKIYI